MDRLCNPKYFSIAHLKASYWQTVFDERDREKTDLITPDGPLQVEVMPLGLCTAPATSQRVMDTVLAVLVADLSRI